MLAGQSRKAVSMAHKGISQTRGAPEEELNLRAGHMKKGLGGLVQGLLGGFRARQVASLPSCL